MSNCNKAFERCGGTLFFGESDNDNNKNDKHNILHHNNYLFNNNYPHNCQKAHTDLYQSSSESPTPTTITSLTTTLTTTIRTTRSSASISPTAPVESETQSSSSSNKTPVIAGAVVGVLLAACLILGFFVRLVRRRKNRLHDEGPLDFHPTKLSSATPPFSSGSSAVPKYEEMPDMVMPGHVTGQQTPVSGGADQYSAPPVSSSTTPEMGYAAAGYQYPAPPPGAYNPYGGMYAPQGVPMQYAQGYYPPPPPGSDYSGYAAYPNQYPYAYGYPAYGAEGYPVATAGTPTSPVQAPTSSVGMVPPASLVATDGQLKAPERTVSQGVDRGVADADGTLVRSSSTRSRGSKERK
ncbi:hypothetical protein HK097_006441 [Rhizophlyctis rosea]|uniref:Transmembrane protein n=1 Tax=Rhizophlyctis rosea TaxID=64517 RepID=A0AAD5SEE5_9FUNG|nr:hypothetical protein HK097_006441 [Rhizophlyctis rosea]